MNKYIEVVEHGSDLVIKRLSVTLCSEDGADFIYDNLFEEINHNTHYLRKVKCKDELETGEL